MNEYDMYLSILVIMVIFINLSIPFNCEPIMGYDINKLNCSLVKKVVLIIDMIVMPISLAYLIDLYKNKGDDKHQ